jgi:tRNA A-37 threonylcarbamoyl transferase component Bud32
MNLAATATSNNAQPDLQALSREGTDTFRLTLTDAMPFDCLEIVRRVPDKRIVCRGIWNNQSVYAKLFIGNQAQRYATRDLRGVLALTETGIATPRLLHAGLIAGQPVESGNIGEALIFATVADCVNAEQAWNSLFDHGKRHLLAQSLVREVAHHHQAGLIQHDLYLKNFLLQGEKIYTLDGDSIRLMPKLLGRKAALKNLAILLSKFDVSDETIWFEELLALYAQVRGWQTAPDGNIMHILVSACRHKMAKDYAEKKVFRQCSDVEVEKTTYFFQAVSRNFASEALRQELKIPDDLLEDKQKYRLKSGNTCTVSMTEVDGREIVVKRYNIKNFWHGLSRALRPTRAARSWGNAHRLMIYRVATAAPVALLERRYGPIRRQAYFLAEYIDASDAVEFFADVSVDSVHKSVVADNIAHIFYKLYLLKIEHGDCKATNIKIVDGKPVLIDLDSMREYHCNWWYSRCHVRDLRRFMRNWQHDIAARNILVAAFRAVYSDTSLLDKAGIVIL